MRNRTNYNNIFILIGILILITATIAIFRFNASESVINERNELLIKNEKLDSIIVNNKNLLNEKDSIIITLKQKYVKITEIYSDSLNNLDIKYASTTINNNLDITSTYWYVYFETSNIRGFDIIKLKSEWNLTEAIELIRKSSNIKSDEFIGIQARWQTSEKDYLIYQKSE
jgi:hypothetical protein